LERPAATGVFRGCRLLLVPIVVIDPARPWRARWIEHATQITLRRLEDDVGGSQAGLRARAP